MLRGSISGPLCCVGPHRKLMLAMKCTLINNEHIDEVLLLMMNDELIIFLKLN